uniref:fibrinogen alpha-1 chain-like isoform X2 n=1 Tax=Myxine glutinosa TaxID=7769 RepID=UPI00358E6C07
MWILYLSVIVAFLTCQGGAEELTPRGPRPNMPGAQSREQCSPQDYNLCTDSLKGKVCPSGCRLSWLMRAGETEISTRINSLVSRLDAIDNRGKTLVVNFRQAHNQANTILSESNAVDESHGKLLHRLEQYVLHLQNRIVAQLRRLQQLRAALLAQLQSILRLEIDIDMALRTCKGACTKTVTYHLDKEMSERLEKAAALLARADLFAVDRLVGTERTVVTSMHTGPTRTDTHYASGSAGSTGTHPSTGSTGTHPSTGSTGTHPSTGSTGTHPSTGSGTYSSYSSTGTHPSTGSGTYSSFSSTGTHPSTGSTGTHPSTGSGTYSSYSSTGTHPSTGSTGTHPSTGSGTYSSYSSTGTHPSTGSTGTHPSTGSTGTHPSTGSTGTHPSTGSTGTHPSTGSGTYSSYSSTGTHPSTGSTGTHSSYGSTDTHSSFGSTGTGAAYPSGGMDYLTPGLGRTDVGTHPVGGATLDIGSHDSSGRSPSTTITEHYTTSRHPPESHTTFHYQGRHGSEHDLNYPEENFRQESGVQTPAPHFTHSSAGGTGSGSKDTKILDSTQTSSSHTSYSSSSHSMPTSTGGRDHEHTFTDFKPLPEFESLPAFDHTGGGLSSGGLSSTGTFTSSSSSLSPVALSPSSPETDHMSSRSTSGSTTFTSSTSSSSHSSKPASETGKDSFLDSFGVSDDMKRLIAEMRAGHGAASASFGSDGESMTGGMSSMDSHHTSKVTKRVWVETLSNGTKVTRTEIIRTEGGPTEVSSGSFGSGDVTTTLPQRKVRGLRKRRSKKSSKQH